MFGRECLRCQSWLRFETRRTAMGGAKWKELPGASANSTGQVTTTNTVTDRDSTSQTTSFCSCAIISHTTTETTVFATPDEEIIMTTSTETIEGRAKICFTTKQRRSHHHRQEVKGRHHLQEEVNLNLRSTRALTRTDQMQQGFRANEAPTTRRSECEPRP